MKNNNSLDKKKVKLYFTGFFSAKNSRFIKSAGGGWVQ
jgi:hypothetical protein